MSVAEDTINRALERESWAREKLAAHAGRTVRLAVGPLDRTIAIGADGRLSAAAQAPDLTLAISPLRLPNLLAAPERWNELVTTTGDPALAATLAELALTLPWFVEQTLAGLHDDIERLLEHGVFVLFVQNLAVASRRAACGKLLRVGDCRTNDDFSSH